MQASLLKQHTEPITNDELKFLKDKELEERHPYFKVYQLFMIASFVFPYIFAWYRAKDGITTAFSKVRFFSVAGMLLFVFAFVVYVTYRVFHYKLQLDIKHKTKTIDTNKITGKTYVTNSNTYHFYLDSLSKISIEVSESDFYNFEIGDEICIEYFTYSQEYIGYY